MDRHSLAFEVIGSAPVIAQYRSKREYRGGPGRRAMRR